MGGVTSMGTVYSPYFIVIIKHVNAKESLDDLYQFVYLTRINYESQITA